MSLSCGHCRAREIDLEQRARESSLADGGLTGTKGPPVMRRPRRPSARVDRARRGSGSGLLRSGPPSRQARGIWRRSTRSSEAARRSSVTATLIAGRDRCAAVAQSGLGQVLPRRFRSSRSSPDRRGCPMRRRAIPTSPGGASGRRAFARIAPGRAIAGWWCGRSERAIRRCDPHSRIAGAAWWAISVRSTSSRKAR